MMSSCDSLPDLTKPTRLSVEQTTLTLNWTEVKDARLYTISIQKDSDEPKEYIASKNTYVLSHLDAGSYKIKVKANGKNEISNDSEWSDEITFVREPEPGMVFNLIDGKTAYEITGKGIATGNIVIPDTYRGLPVTSIGDKAFFNKSDVTGITFGENTNIKNIGQFAFANCSYLTAISLPDSLETLGDNAFASCRLLSGEIVIPDGVKEIPQNAFSYCAQITGVKLGDGVKSIGKMAFTDCKALASVELPDGLLSIGEYAFSKCESLESVELGEKLEAIGAYAFSANAKITEVVIPDAVKTIGEGAFFDCSALENVTLGAGVETFGMGAFHSTKIWELNPGENEVYVGKWFVGLKDASAAVLNLRPDTVGIANFALVNNKNLSVVTLPNSVKLIGEAAFAQSNISNIAIGSGVEVIGEQAFIGCEKLSVVILGSFDTVEGTIEFSSLKTIGNYAFQECSMLESIEMPDTLKSVGTYAFKDSGLGKTSEDGVVYAGNWAVGYLEEVQNYIEIADGTVGIANYAFYNCKGIQMVDVPSSVKIIGRAAFYDCAGLININLPDTLEAIDDYTFYRCVNLKLFSLPSMLRSIGRSAFYKCATSAEAINADTDNDILVIPPSVEYIGDFAFYGCAYQETVEMQTVTYGVETIVIGDGVRTIGSNAFYGLLSLKSLVIGNGVESIGEKAFYKCESLKEVTFGSSVETIGSKAFYKCTALVGVSLPDSLVTLGEYAFYKCEALETVTLGSGIETIEKYAFYGDVKLKSITFPESLTSIGKQAFRNCDSLTSVILTGNLLNMDMHVFYGCDNLTVYSSLSAPLEGWNKYWNSSYRPIIWSCVLSEDNDYVISFEKNEGSIKNKNDSNAISNPAREGYTFIGWGTNSSAVTADYTSETIFNADNGRKLYAIWQQE